jgi:hypothetical protein
LRCGNEYFFDEHDAECGLYRQTLINKLSVYPIVIAKGSSKIINMLVIVETQSIESRIFRIQLPIEKNPKSPAKKKISNAVKLLKQLLSYYFIILLSD